MTTTMNEKFEVGSTIWVIDDANLKAEPIKVTEVNGNIVRVSKEDLEKLKKLRDSLNNQWTEHREKIYHEKLREIENAHNNWMADRVEDTLNAYVEKERNSDEAARTMRLNPEDYE